MFLVAFFCLSLCLSACLSVCLYLSVRVSFCPSVCPCVTLFHSQTVFVKWLLGVQLFVDILYIFVNETPRAFF